MSAPPRTEYSFTLPVGFVDGDGALHREGAMRLATARDEIEPLRDARARENDAYLSVLKLARVLTRVGDIEAVTPALVEQLYAADFAHLRHLYAQINSASPATVASPVTTAPAASVAPAPVAPTQAPPVPSTAAIARAQVASEHAPAATPAPVPPASARPPALAGVSDAAMQWMLQSGAIASGPAEEPDRAMPIGVIQDRQRTIAREAMMRSPLPPRRGRVVESPDTHAQPFAPDAPPHNTLPHDAHAHETPAAPLMRLGARPAASGALASSAAGFAEASTHSSTPTGEDIEDIYEQMIARLRRELLVERERMGTSLGA